MKSISLAIICYLRLLTSLLPISIRDNQKFTDFQLLQHAHKIKKKQVTTDPSAALFPQSSDQVLVAQSCPTLQLHGL